MIARRKVCVTSELTSPLEHKVRKGLLYTNGSRKNVFSDGNEEPVDANHHVFERCLITSWFVMFIMSES